LAARLAAAFGASGAHVGVVCPRGSPLLSVSSVREVFQYAALSPVEAIASAMRAMNPDAVVPCDERALGHLHSLYTALPADDDLRKLIERSLGDPAGYAVVRSRGQALELANRDGSLEPGSRELRSEADVRDWCANRSFPAVIKADGTWGGSGVAVVDSPVSALAAFRRMSRPLATWRVAKFMLSNRDPYPLRGWLDRARPGIIGQDFVKGRAANIMVACWRGEVLASVSAVALETADDLGAATIVRLIEHREMEAVAAQLVRRLGISGFCGIDFILEEVGGRAFMIELNPRATQLGHLPFGPAGSLVSVFLARLRGESAPTVKRPWIAAQGTVAFFPQAWLASADSPLLPLAYPDVPWREPALLRELLRRPWDVRSPLAILTGFLMRRPDPARILAKSFANLQPPDLTDEPSERILAIAERGSPEAGSGSEATDDRSLFASREPPQGGICVLSRQRIVGNTNGSSTYLLSLCEALHRDGHALHLLCPSPSMFGRWPALLMGPDMAIFRSIKIRGALRIGNIHVAVNPTVLRRAVVGFLGKALARLGIRVAALSKPAPYSIGLPWDPADLRYVEKHAPRRADGVLVDYAFLTEGVARIPAPRGPSAVVMHDLFSSRPALYGPLGADPTAGLVDRDREMTMLSRADAVIAIQAEEAAKVQRQLPATRVLLAPMATVPVAAPQAGTGSELLFIGSNTSPNVDALHWFFGEVWPSVRRANPAVRLNVVGNVAASFPTAPDGVVMVGRVDDLTTPYASAAVVISPLRGGSGLKIKLIEALGHGKAIVATTTTLQGVTDIVGSAVIVADDAQAFAEAIATLLKDAALRATFGARALAVVRDHFSPEACYADVVAHFRPRR
jgi:succinoglycan biosynthesis protein ExoO